MSGRAPALMAGFVALVIGLTVGGLALAGALSPVSVVGVALLGAVVCGLVVSAYVARERHGWFRRLADLVPDLDEVESINDVEEGIERWRKRFENIRGDRRKYEAVLEEFSDGVFAVDGDEIVLYVNTRAEELLEIDRESPEGLPIYEVTRLDEVCSLVTEALQTGEEQAGEVRRVRPSGERILEVQTSPLRSDPDGREGVVASIRDVTELRRLETVRQDFVANVSHELKTPLTAVRGLVETLLSDSEMDPETRRRFLNKINRQNRRMTNLVQDLLTISRLESEDDPLEQVPVDLVDLIRESISPLREAMGEKDLELELNLPDEDMSIEGDSSALRQLVTNLVDNAIKYTSEGGRITVALLQTDGHVRLTVEDTGVGIEPRQQDRIFERFYRVSESRSREVGGTGLGLAIVKHVTLSHDGEIDLESTPGKGSTFTVTFPVP